MKNFAQTPFVYNQAALGRLAVCLLSHEPQTTSDAAMSVLSTRLGAYGPNGSVLDRVVGDYFRGR